MSNPGVITLASIRNVGRNIHRLDIEDNIGEAIHIHLNSLRMDFSVEEFLMVADAFIHAGMSLEVFQKYQLERLDPHFLFKMSDLIQDIRKVEIQSCRLGDLRSLVRVRIPKNNYVMLPRQIKYSPAYRFLKGESDYLTEYMQHNYLGVNNVTRLEKLRDSIKKNGYRHDSGYIVLFGDQKFIRDGQHRAAVLASLGGFDQEIPVMVFHFTGNRWRLKPYRQVLKTFVKKIAVYGMRKAKRVLQRLENLG